MRDHLAQVIDMFSLRGLIDTCVWDIKNNKLNINAVSPYQDLTVYIKADLNCKDGKIGVYSASQLKGIISIMNDDFMFLPEPKQNIILISDNNYDVKLRTADTTIIPKAPTVKVPPTPSITIDLTTGEFAQKCAAAYKSLKTDTIYFNTRDSLFGGFEPHIVLGEQDSYENTIEIKQNGECTEMTQLPFSIEMINNILSLSSGFNGTLKVYPQGLISIQLQSDKITSEYYVVRKS